MRKVALSLAIISIIGNLASAFSSSSSASSASLTSRTLSSSQQQVPSLIPTMREKKKTAPPLFGITNSPNQSSHGKAAALSKTARAGASIENAGEEEENISGPAKVANFVASFWAAGGFVAILLNSIRRIVPVAMEPLKASSGTSATAAAAAEGAAAALQPLTQFQLAVYVLTCIWFAYVEGYKGFQRKFSPMVVSRSFTLKIGESSFHHFLLGPFYAMGLFHATKKRMIVSWSVTIGVAAIVVAVKKLPYPWRNIVDAGVVVGLTWGSLSILLGYVMSLITGNVKASAELPEKK